MPEERAILDLGAILPFVLEHARFVGPGLLVAAVVVRTFFRAASIALFAVGAIVVGVSAIREWQGSNDPVLVGVVLGAGLGLFGMLAWAVRKLSLVIVLGLFAAGWYLLLYGWVGPDFLGTGAGVAIWAAATALSAVTAARLRWRGVTLAAQVVAGAAAL